MYVCKALCSGMEQWVESRFGQWAESLVLILWSPANIRGGPELYTIRKLWGILMEKSGSREKQMGLKDISEVGFIGFNDQLNVRHEKKKNK